MKTYEQEHKEHIKQAEVFRDAAFPVDLELQYESRPNMAYKATSKGLSKREYFASAILQGMMSIPDNTSARKASAWMAVEIADELIIALIQTGSQPVKGDM